MSRSIASIWLRLAARRRSASSGWATAESNTVAPSAARVVGFGGGLVWDASKPDGTPRKVLDVSRIEALGWRARTDLEPGLARTCDRYLRHVDEARRAGASTTAARTIRSMRSARHQDPSMSPRRVHWAERKFGPPRPAGAPMRYGGLREAAPGPE